MVCAGLDFTGMPHETLVLENDISLSPDFTKFIISFDLIFGDRKSGLFL